MDKGLLTIGAITVAVIGVMLGIAFLSPEAKPQLGQKFDDQGREHIAEGAEHPAYNSNPPTSGWHYDQPADWGVYTSPLPDERVVHNLEHGGVWISYNLEKADENMVKQLTDLTKQFPSKVILTPRAANEKAIALASWRYNMNLDTYDEATIRDFIARNKNKAPEYFPD